MAYDRDVVINCVKQHYEHLVKAAYFNSAKVQYPLDKGWSNELLWSVLHSIKEYSNKIRNKIKALIIVPCLKGSKLKNRTI